MNLETISRDAIIGIQMHLSTAELIVIKGQLVKLTAMKQRISNEPRKTVWLSDEEAKAISRIAAFVSKIIPEDISSFDEIETALFAEETEKGV